ncbi:MAG: hypothetical protein ACPIOQ_64610, partial [Promethearchaeia archaeon]
ASAAGRRSRQAVTRHHQRRGRDHPGWNSCRLSQAGQEWVESGQACIIKEWDKHVLDTHRRTG